jgi:hypothetical protein
VKYKVEQLLAHGWEDAGWREDDEPLLFNTEKEASDEIADHVDSARSAGLKDYSRSNYRVVKVISTEERYSINETCFLIGHEIKYDTLSDYANSEDRPEAERGSVINAGFTFSRAVADIAEMMEEAYDWSGDHDGLYLDAIYAIGARINDEPECISDTLTDWTEFINSALENK